MVNLGSQTGNFWSKRVIMHKKWVLLVENGQIIVEICNFDSKMDDFGYNLSKLGYFDTKLRVKNEWFRAKKRTISV